MGNNLTINKILISIIFIAFIFTAIDGILHFLINYLEIKPGISYFTLSPLSTYMLGKFITTIIVGIIILFILSYTNLSKRGVIFYFSIILTIILEIRYFYYDYTYNWHVINMIIHFILLYIISLLILNLED